MRHNWRASLKNFCRLQVLLIQFFPVAFSVKFCLCMRSATSPVFMLVIILLTQILLCHFLMIQKRSGNLMVDFFQESLKI